MKMDEIDQRKQVIEEAKSFKTHWVKLGEHLTTVAKGKLYEGWGFKKFEDYCLVELKIKKSTAIKLTNAYNFLTSDEPDLVESGIDIDVVSVLQKAKKDDSCTEDQYEEIRDLAVNKGRGKNAVDKAYKKIIKHDDDPTKAFYQKSQSMANQLLSRIKPIDNVPENFKSMLDELSKFFATQSEYSGV